MLTFIFRSAARRIVATVIALCGLAMVLPLASQETPARTGAAQLAPIVGSWQSDTSSGTSARSDCVWTPQHGAVLCEQTITNPSGSSRALNLFTFNRATAAYALYVVSQPGNPAYQVPFTVRGNVWIYEGASTESDGTAHRTVNIFNGLGASYIWRQESRVLGGNWVAGAHGRATRVR